jgi:uncharacterized protein (DUF362 family)/Pyruvate/2-oxoacid:ferredoxin oxidoreductase delta subunit
MKSRVSIVRCRDYQPELVSAKVKEAIGLLGGIGFFVKPGSRVLVKPNLLMAKPPEAGIDTHPEVVRAVIKALKEINSDIYVGDGPSVWGNQAENVDEVYRQTGIAALCAQEGVHLVHFDNRRWRGRFPLTTWLDQCQYLVSVPKFKTHEFTLLTGAIKNLYGLVSGTYKTELHKKYYDKLEFGKILVDIFQCAPPALTVVDGIVAMEGDGPATSGTLRNQGILVASADAVALDSVLALIMGIKPDAVVSIREAKARGLGESDIRAIEIAGEKIEDVSGRPFYLPQTSLRSRIPQPVVNFIKRFIRYRPEVVRGNCINCGACIEACPNKIISRKNGVIAVDYAQCISCFCCQEACPNSAIRVKKSLLARLTGL